MTFLARRSLRAPRTGLVAGVLAACALWRCGKSPATPTSPQPTPTPTPLGPPNIVLIVADDMGYADLACYGAPLIKTPNLDRLASEGLRFTQFTVPSPLCSPARGSLLTGLYPPQTGLIRNLGPGNTTGIDADEETLAEVLKSRGYATGMVGKWGLGDLPQFLPTHNGFDSYFGIPSNSDLGLLTRGDRPAPDAVSEDQLNRYYTQEATGFIRSVTAKPFFLYLAYQAPHVPLWVSSAFRGRSAGGLYGDVVEELDWGVGEVVKALRDQGVDRNTLLIFMSDNGPWLAKGAEAGSAGLLRDGKGTPFEGGIREPFIVWSPARVSGGRVVTQPVHALDVFPTVVAMAGGTLPSGRTYRGLNLSGLFSGEVSRLPGSGVEGGRELLTYSGGAVVALRSGKYKILRAGFWSPTPGLFDLEADPGEEFDLMRSKPELAAQLSDRLDALAGEVARGAPPTK